MNEELLDKFKHKKEEGGSKNSSLGGEQRYCLSSQGSG